MAAALTIADINTQVNHDPRMMDLRLAEALEFTDRHMVRRLVDRHREALERFGTIAETKEKPSHRGGRPGKTYWLNKKQALYLCTKSETPNATEVTIQMVEVFDAVTKGEAPTISAQPKQQFDDNPAINRLAQEWSQRDFRRYQKYLVDHMRHMRDIGWTDTAEAALSQLSVDPTLIGRVGTTFNSFEGASVSIKDGRYLVVVRNAKVVEARDVAGSCVINGDDPMNVYTFLREFVPAANIPVALEIVSQRAVAIMKRGATVPTSQDGTVPSRVKL